MNVDPDTAGPIQDETVGAKRTWRLTGHGLCEPALVSRCE